MMNHHACGNHSDVASFTFDISFPEWYGVLLFRNLSRYAKTPFMVVKNNRVVIPNGCFQQSLGIVRRGGKHELQTGIVHYNRFRALGVFCPEFHATADSGHEDHRNFDPASMQKVPFGCLDDFVPGNPHEVC